MHLYVTLLAGGLGKRMESTTPKVLHKIDGETMITRLINRIVPLNPERILIVIGKGLSGDMIRSEVFTETPKVWVDKIQFVVQEKPQGTGDAVKATLPYISESAINLILNGDVPLIQSQTIQSICEQFVSKSSEIMVTAIHLDNPFGCGRIIKVNKDGVDSCQKIIEEKDCEELEKEIKLVNTGIYICRALVLHSCVPLITNNNTQKEYYLTDIVSIYHKLYGKTVDLFCLKLEQQIEIYNINTREQLAFAEQIVSDNN